jgi:transposase-like protein
MAKRGRPRKSQDFVKKRVLQIRLLQQEKQGFEEAAKFAGLSLSSWARERLRAVARKELESASKKISF